MEHHLAPTFSLLVVPLFHLAEEMEDNDRQKSSQMNDENRDQISRYTHVQMVLHMPISPIESPRFSRKPCVKVHSPIHLCSKRGVFS